jgi:hypothetical protein
MLDTDRSMAGNEGAPERVVTENIVEHAGPAITVLGARP